LKVLEFTVTSNIAITKFIKQHRIELECILFYLLASYWLGYKRATSV